MPQRQMHVKGFLKRIFEKDFSQTQATTGYCILLYVHEVPNFEMLSICSKCLR